MHEYYERKVNNDTQIDKHLSNYWKKDRFVTSQQKDYLSTIRDQESPTKYLRYKWARKTPDCNNKCRLCTTNIENISHVIARCCNMSTRYYLPLRHDEVAKTLLNSHLKKSYPSKNITLSYWTWIYIYLKKNHVNTSGMYQ